MWVTATDVCVECCTRAQSVSVRIGAHTSNNSVIPLEHKIMATDIQITRDKSRECQCKLYLRANKYPKIGDSGQAHPLGLTLGKKRGRHNGNTTTSSSSG